MDAGDRFGDQEVSKSMPKSNGEMKAPSTSSGLEMPGSSEILGK